MKRIRQAAAGLMSGSFDKLSTLFSAAIIALWIQSFGDWWWAETYAVIYSMLISTVILAFLIPWKKVSIPVQLVFVLLTTLIFSGLQWPQLYPSGTTAENRWILWLRELTEQLSPFVWISLGVWLVVQASVILSKQRKGLIVVVGSALFSLSVIDSLFTPIRLWQEVASIVSIGLLWLVVSHFEQFRKKHPGSWRDLLDYPISLVASVLVVIVLVMAGGIFLPSIEPVIRDPYTVWKESRGEAVPSMIGDKIGIEVVTPAGPGDSRSGYSRNDEVLGGGFTFDYSPVMEVTTTRRSYWRGETKEVYTGRGWDDTRNEIDLDPVTRIKAGDLLEASGQGAGPTTQIQQTFTMLREEDRFPVLFGASPISSVVMIDEEGMALPALRWLPSSWELRMPGNSRTYPTTYSVTSEVIQLDEAAVRKISAEQAAGDMNDVYLQLPANLPQRVRTLAAEITKDQTTAYDKVKAIEAYLQQNYTYNNEPDLTKKLSKDMVDGFLFEMKEGYCDYFSTAMAVLTRSLDIPARWVKGYSPGALPPNPAMQGYFGGDPEAIIDPNGAGTYTVRNSDAHSWVEVYFDGYGWLPFEPTTGFAYPYALPETADAPETVVVPEDVTTEVAAEEEDNKGFSTGWIIGSAVAVVLLSATTAFILYYRRNGLSLRLQRGGTNNANERIVRETERLIRYCRRKGLDRSEHETVRETMNRWSGHMTSLEKEFKSVQSAFEKAKYSAQSLSDEEVARFESNAKVIRERLSS
ncbi:transglutaminase-like putative cysteine protease [Paenibacillus phyllosphaerae]|uniref:Transglutaminase-like putative cysteine protease n=1 Tax=Paenibacillus phyllosphaerae TaxID=274593 RepID=A0A7W5AUC5_9BACL|nr:transglutaminase domain-containing protein [Paenibacillus phyllosphaerae]MBB3108934.1 transglutaminase-like putative cysteine protease [Paenibacillus phyllosphaerae]